MNPLVLRAAQPQDFAFCERIYFEEMGYVITQLNLDMARQRENFARQWRVAEVRIITLAGEDIGWLQSWPADEAIFRASFFWPCAFSGRASAAMFCTCSLTRPSGLKRRSPLTS